MEFVVDPAVYANMKYLKLVIPLLMLTLVLGLYSLGTRGDWRSASSARLDSARRR